MAYVPRALSAAQHGAFSTAEQASAPLSAEEVAPGYRVPGKVAAVSAGWEATVLAKQRGEAPASEAAAAPASEAAPGAAGAADPPRAWSKPKPRGDARFAPLSQQQQQHEEEKRQPPPQPQQQQWRWRQQQEERRQQQEQEQEQRRQQRGLEPQQLTPQQLQPQLQPQQQVGRGDDADADADGGHERRHERRRSAAEAELADLGLGETSSPVKSVLAAARSGKGWAASADDPLRDASFANAVAAMPKVKCVYDFSQVGGRAKGAESRRERASYQE